MNIYLLERTDNGGYDSFDAIVVIAHTDNDAKSIHPYGDAFEEGTDDYFESWVKRLNQIKCTKIGVADKDQKRGVVLASFNAG